MTMQERAELWRIAVATAPIAVILWWISYTASEVAWATGGGSNWYGVVSGVTLFAAVATTLCSVACAISAFAASSTSDHQR
jgi:hypothetical protein